MLDQEKLYWEAENANLDDRVPKPDKKLTNVESDEINIKCNTDENNDFNDTIIFKTTDKDNNDYFSKYLVLKINNKSNFGESESSVSIDTNWKNSKLNRSGIIYNFKINGDKTQYEDKNYCDKIIKILPDKQIKYNDITYSRLTLPKEYLLYYTLPSTTTAATTAAPTTAAPTTAAPTTAAPTTAAPTTAAPTTAAPTTVAPTAEETFIGYKEYFEDAGTTAAGTTAAGTTAAGTTTSVDTDDMVMFLYGELFEDDSHIRIPQIDSDTKCNEEYIFEYTTTLEEIKNKLNIKHLKIYVCDIKFSEEEGEQAYLVFNSTTDIKIYNGEYEELYDIKKIVPQNVTPRTTQTVPQPIDRKYPTLQHNIKDHNLHKHNDIMPDKLNEHGDPSRPVHIHNFFDDHHHPEKNNNELKDTYIYSDIKKYKDKKNGIDEYVDYIIITLKKKSINFVKDLFKTELGSFETNYFYLLKQNLEDSLIKTNDVRLKLILREILYNEFLNKVEGKTNPVNPLNPNNLPCMYYTDFNCPVDKVDEDGNLIESGHCVAVPDPDPIKASENLNIKCIPKDKKKVSTCLDLYGKNNCEKHYIDNKDNTCKWSEWDGANGRKLGKCSSDGNVPKIKEECSTDNYLIKKYGKAELSNTLIDSICLPKDDETYKLLYDNPNYINNKNIKNNKGGEIVTNVLKTLCESNPESKDIESFNRWDPSSENCYKLKDIECHKKSKETCDISNDHYLDQKLLDQSSELYDVHKNQVCFWRQLHYSKNPEYSNEYPNEYTEKGICENLL